MNQHRSIKGKIWTVVALLLMSCMLLFGCGQTANLTGQTGSSSQSSEQSSNQNAKATVDSNEEKSEQVSSDGIKESGTYTSKMDVANYIHQFGKLPSNFITKNEARKLGWPGGGLDDYADGKCIGGDYFGNYEGKLPKNDKYHECDIDTLHQNSRGAKRIIYSDSGKIYYTDDHYETFTEIK